MPPNIPRRTFLQVLLSTPLAALLRPRAAQAPEPGYSDDLGTLDLSALSDSNLITGIEYPA